MSLVYINSQETVCVFPVKTLHPNHIIAEAICQPVWTGEQLTEQGWTSEVSSPEQEIIHRSYPCGKH